MEECSLKDIYVLFSQTARDPTRTNSHNNRETQYWNSVGIL